MSRQSGLQDDRALLELLATSRKEEVWQLLYIYYRQPLIDALQELGSPTNDLGDSVARSFSKMLSGIRQSKGRVTLLQSLFHGLLLEALCLNQLPDTNCSNAVDRNAYLAKKALVQGLRKQPEVFSTACYNSFKKPAHSLLHRSFDTNLFEFEDIYQVAFTELCKNPPPVEDQRKAQLFSFFMVILNRRVIDQLNRQNKFPRTDAEAIEVEISKEKPPIGNKVSNFWDSVDEQYQISERFKSQDARKALAAAIKQLSSKCQLLIRQRFFSELPFKKIAEINGFDINSVGKRISRCREKLKDLLIGSHKSKEA